MFCSSFLVVVVVVVVVVVAVVIRQALVFRPRYILEKLGVNKKVILP